MWAANALHRSPNGTLAYRLHAPPRLEGPVPLLVALHGCLQTASDFAQGTRFDALADRYGALVVYPEQSLSHNHHRCWNWFLAAHQHRDRGEPAEILAIVRDVAARFPVDPERVFVAGLSAGGAMAAVLGEQAPDVFAAVGIMAGVALHASHDVASARAAMRGQPTSHPAAVALRHGHALRAGAERLRVSIWSGARDDLVDPANARCLAAQFVRLLGITNEPVTATLPDGALSRWRDGRGRVRVELRSVDALGHAWSGGSLRGSHTAPFAPRASDAMFGFFMAEASHAAAGQGPASARR